MRVSALFVAGNIACWLLVVAVQRFEARIGRIPARGRWRSERPFLYFQDWAIATWGDLIGLSLIDGAAGSVVLAMGGASIAGVFGIGAVAAIVFHARCLSASHRPDAGYPAHGRVSWHGRVHLAFFFAQSSACAIALIAAIEGVLTGGVLAIAVAGSVVYLVSFGRDMALGKFAPYPS